MSDLSPWTLPKLDKPPNIYAPKKRAKRASMYAIIDTGRKTMHGLSKASDKRNALMAVPSGSINTDKRKPGDKSAAIRGKL